MTLSLLKRLSACGLALLLGMASAYAVPAKPGVVQYTQSDGSKIAVTIHGDENSHYYMTTDGYVLLPGADGDLCYASMAGNSFATTSVKAKAAGLTAEESTLVGAIDRAQVLEAVSNQARLRTEKMRSLRSTKALSPKGVEMISSYPTIGSPKALIMLVQFKDVKFRTPNTLEAFTALTNEHDYSYNGATGSAYDYFYENSNGLFSPEFVVLGPVTLDNNESYYGQPEGQMYDKQAWKMMTEGSAKLREMYPDLDFSEFDNDGDGFVDNIFIYYAGYGQNEGAESWTVWPHAANVYTYYGANIEYDGVKLGNYACTNELRGTLGTTLTGIGTFCHEFSHILGLPDLYPTNNSGAFTPGSFELMDIGPYNNNGNTPPYMSAFDRMSLGWLKILDLSGPENVQLNSIASNEAVRIPTEKENEFFVLENRQQTGWDTFIEGHGMLIWHIDFDVDLWNNNTVNNNTSHMCVDIIEADGIPNSTTRAGDPFPGTNRVTSFTANTTPAMKTWIGIDPDMPITDIRETDGIITFKVKGGGDRIEAIEALEATDITATSFVAHWTTRPEIPTYELDLCRGNEVLPFRTITVKTAGQTTITDLDPATLYRYIVRAVDGELKSLDSNEITVTTADPTFDMLSNEATAATNVSSEAFTANWTALDQSEAYELSVYTKDIIDPEVFTADFSSVGSSTDFVPEGWSTTCTATDSRAGYFGQARPSLKMSARTQLQTPVYTDDVNYIRFWYRGNSSLDTDRLEIEVLLAGQWVLLHTITDIDKSAGHTFEISNETDVKMPVGAKSVRLKFFTDGGATLCVDDVELGAGGAYVPVYLDGYQQKNVGNTTAHRVSGLQRNTTYYYTVHGLSGELKSIESNEIAVTTSASAALDNIASDNSGIIFTATADGIAVCNLTSEAQPLQIATPTGIVVAATQVAPGATATIALAPGAIYIAKCGHATQKLTR